MIVKTDKQTFKQKLVSYPAKHQTNWLSKYYGRVGISGLSKYKHSNKSQYLTPLNIRPTNCQNTRDELGLAACQNTTNISVSQK